MYTLCDLRGSEVRLSTTHRCNQKKCKKILHLFKVKALSNTFQILEWQKHEFSFKSMCGTQIEAPSEFWEYFSSNVPSLTEITLNIILYKISSGKLSLILIFGIGLMPKLISVKVALSETLTSARSFAQTSQISFRACN